MSVSEMECATLFIVASKRGLKVGAVVGTDSNIWQKKQFDLKTKETMYMEAEKKTIAIALKAVVNLSNSKV